MAAFDGLVKEILPYVPGCPDTLVLNTLRAATIDLCEKSKAYVFDLDPISTVSGVYEYDFDQPTATEVHQVLWMTYNGNDLDPITPRSLELNFPDWRDRSSIPQVYLQKNPNTFCVIPVPNATLSNGLMLSVALKPTRTASSIDTTFSNQYRDGIVYGTLHRLLRIPNRDWSDINSANNYFTLFSEEVRQAELKGRGGDLGVPRKVHYKGVGLNPRKRYRRYGKEIDY
tara:strand:+ start:2442 stop:3125 length:684 start_codon:yes stop_codon:yes gene_type:complete